MERATKLLVFVILFFIKNIYAATIDSIRLWKSPDNTRIVFDMDEAVIYKSFILENPYRLVIDFDASQFKTKNLVKDIKWQHTDVVNLRHSTNKNKLRIVLDLKDSINYKIFDLVPNSQIEAHRVVLDIESKAKKIQQIEDLPKMTKIVSPKTRLFNVIIDPGHGGEDPGAIGSSGTKEKDIVLEVSKYLKYYIDQDKDMRAFLTRDSDYYIGLTERTEKARGNQADLFVSIHADGFKDWRPRGASVYVLSERGASSELAKWIADHENKSDLVGGVKIDDKDTMLATVLLDLSQTASNRSSNKVANSILDELSKVSYLHKTNVEQAGFRVLKSPDIPSVLVETGFISNPKGERMLRTSSYQRKLAYSIYKGIKSYFKTQPRPAFDDVIMQAKN